MTKYEQWMAEFKAEDARKALRESLAKVLIKHGLWNKAA